MLKTATGDTSRREPFEHGPGRKIVKQVIKKNSTLEYPARNTLMQGAIPMQRSRFFLKGDSIDENNCCFPEMRIAVPLLASWEFVERKSVVGVDFMKR